VVLLPSKGFGSDHPSVRVSLANLNETDYRKIGTATRKLLDSYYEAYKKSRK
jgi:aspartate 4-decarboxylase